MSILLIIKISSLYSEYFKIFKFIFSLYKYRIDGLSYNTLLFTFVDLNYIITGWSEDFKRLFFDKMCNKDTKILSFFFFIYIYT